MLYNSKGSGNLSFSAFFRKFVKIKNLEKDTVLRIEENLTLTKRNEDPNHSEQQQKKHFNKTIL